MDQLSGKWNGLNLENSMFMSERSAKQENVQHGEKKRELFLQRFCGKMGKSIETVGKGKIPGQVRRVGVFSVCWRTW